jgi:hypothetical protein
MIMIAETTYKLLIVALIAFTMIICVLEVEGFVLRRRLIATRKMLGEYQLLSLPSRLGKRSIIPTISEMPDTVANRTSNRVTNMPPEVPSFIITIMKKVSNVPLTIKGIIDISFFIRRVYRWLRCLSINIKQNLLAPYSNLT